MNWILLRGLGRDQRHWFDLPEKLQTSLAPDNQVVCLDLPGFGTEASAKTPLTIAGHTDFLRERFLALEKKSGPWSLLGISLGGMIALDWTKRYPQDFSKLIVINSSAKDLSPLLQRASAFALYCMTRASMAKSVADREKEILKMVSNLRLNDHVLLEQLVEIAKSPPFSLENVSRQLMAASLFQSPTSIEVPTLILASMKDRMVDVRCSKALADRYHAQIKFHPTAGHDIPLDDVDWVTERIVEFSKT